jgi:hypothetical protein
MRNGSFAYVRVALNDPWTQADDVREVRKVDEEGETVLVPATSTCTRRLRPGRVCTG